MHSSRPEKPGSPARRRELTLEELLQGLEQSDRSVLARAITLVESVRADHRHLARLLVESILPRTGRAVRVGVTGPPGVGKSTLIESLGLHLVEKGHRVAVLAVDPSSRRTGGSILGDKTRMEQLSREERAYIRPSPGGATPGGVARRSREALLLCEAAGFDVVIVETIGVGQSETAVAEMVDTFVLLVLPGSGDELQGVKRGVMELADLAVVTKADGDQRRLAARTRAQLLSALHLMPPATPGWRTPVLTVSSLEGQGMGSLWEAVLEHHEHLASSALLEERRSEQAAYWLDRALEDGLWARFLGDHRVAPRLEALRAEVRSGRRSPEGVAEDLLDLNWNAPPADRSSRGT